MTPTELFGSVPTEIIGGIPIAALTRAETARLMIDAALARRCDQAPPCVFSSANGQVLSAIGRASSAADPANLIKTADLVSADGQPLVFASRLLGGGRIHERCATTDLFHDVAEIAETEGVTFFLLGATAEENAKAAANVSRDYPRLQIVGTRHGFFDSMADEASTVAWISSLAPAIVWISLGFPREQEFCFRLRDALSGAGVLKTSGGLFNFLSGTQPRAPRWLQHAGLEWAYRAGLEPRRLLARYASTNFHAAWLLLTRTVRASRAGEMSRTSR